MGALDCVSPPGKISSSESTEVFGQMASVTSLDQQRDVESQKGSKKSSIWWNIGIDVPLIVLVFGVLLLFELNVIPGHQSGFYCQDPALSYIFNGDTVSAVLLMTTVLLAPIIIIYVTECLVMATDASLLDRLVEAFWTTMYLMRSYCFGIFMNLAIVEVMKGVTGMPRPTFFDICEPDTNKNCTPNTYVPSYTCTSQTYTAWFQSDAYHSFPSGHTSSSVFFALFISAYLQKRAFSWRGKSVLIVPTLQMLVLAFAAVSSLTRVTDHRHHWWDVLTGTVIGVVSFFYTVLALCNSFSSPKVESEELPNANRIFIR